MLRDLAVHYIKTWFKTNLAVPDSQFRVKLWYSDRCIELTTTQVQLFQSMLPLVRIDLETLLRRLGAWNSALHLKALEIVHPQRNQTVVFRGPLTWPMTPLIDVDNENGPPMSAWFNDDHHQNVLHTAQKFLGRACLGYGVQHQVELVDIWLASGALCKRRRRQALTLTVEFAGGSIKFSNSSSIMHLCD